MGKKKAALHLDARGWRGLVESPAALQPLLETRWVMQCASWGRAVAPACSGALPAHSHRPLQPAKLGFPPSRRPIDVLRQLQTGLSPGGALACEPLSLRCAESAAVSRGYAPRVVPVLPDGPLPPPANLQCLAHTSAMAQRMCALNRLLLRLLPPNSNPAAVHPQAGRHRPAGAACGCAVQRGAAGQRAGHL